MDHKNLNRVWAISLMIISILSLIIGINSIIGVEIPHTYKLIIAIAQIIAGTILIVTTTLKFKKNKSSNISK